MCAFDTFYIYDKRNDFDFDIVNLLLFDDDFLNASGSQ